MVWCSHPHEQVEQAKLVAPRMMPLTLPAEREAAFRMLAKQGVALPFEGQKVLLCICARDARELGERVGCFKELVSLMKPWGGCGDFMSDVTSAGPTARWSWFQTTVLEESLVEYIVAGESSCNHVQTLALEVAEASEESLELDIDGYFVKMVDKTLTVVRLLPNLLQPKLKDIVEQNEAAAMLKEAAITKGSGVKKCVGVAIHNCAFWQSKLDNFIEAHAQASLHSDGMVSAVDNMTQTMEDKDALHADFDSHCNFVVEQCKKLCYYQKALLDGTFTEFSKVLLDFSKVLFDHVKAKYDDNSGDCLALLRSFNKSAVELTIAHPFEQVANDMADSAGEYLSNMQRGRSSRYFAKAVDVLVAMRLDSGNEAAMTTCSNFNDAFNNMGTNFVIEDNGLWENLKKAYATILDFSTECKDPPTIIYLQHSAASLQGLLAAKGMSQKEADALPLCRSLVEANTEWADKSGDDVFGDDCALDRMRAFQQLFANLSSIKDNMDEVATTKFDNYLTTVISKSRANMEKFEIYLCGRKEQAATQARDALHIALSSGVEGGADWDSALPEKCAYAKFQELACKEIARCDLGDLGTNISNYSQA